MRYSDLSSGGRELAAALARHAGREDVLVLGIVRGGVPAAIEVAARLGLPLDLLVRRTLMQQPSGDFLRAVRIAGALVADPELLDLPPGAPDEVRWLVDDGLRALEERERLCRGDRPAVDIKGKTVLLVDCGMRTGGTMRTAVAAVRNAGASAVVAAVPVGAAPACAAVGPLSDEFVCLYTPESLGNVAVAYQRFDVPAFEQIHALLPKL